jgi:predicted XRE-type DNA-binding protein
MEKGKTRVRVAPSSGNVFADLGRPQAEEKKAKVRLAVAINQVVARRGLSQARAARILGINQPKVSALAHYRLDGFSLERLMNFVNRLGHDVEIIIRNKRPRGPARTRVRVA